MSRAMKIRTILAALLLLAALGAAAERAEAPAGRRPAAGPEAVIHPCQAWPRLRDRLAGEYGAKLERRDDSLGDEFGDLVAISVVQVLAGAEDLHRRNAGLPSMIGTG